MRAPTFNIPTPNESNDLVKDLGKEKYKYLEFKHLYFKLQKLIDKKVVLSLKYEQLKAPEVYSTLVKPITTKILSIANTDSLHQKLSRCVPVASSPSQTPKFGPQLGPWSKSNSSSLKVSPFLIYILLMLRYEYMIQSENNLIRFDLLVTKATLCEILAIRMLREYRSLDRINLLFINPMNNFFFSKQTSYDLGNYLQPHFNTLELAILSKAKKLLSQPIIIQILDRFYCGELIIKDYGGVCDSTTLDTLLESNSDEFAAKNSETATLLKDDENIINYKFNKISIKHIVLRSNIVPKYQSLVVNIKHFVLAVLYFIVILDNKRNSLMMNKLSNLASGISYFMGVIEVLFWFLGLSLNFEFLIKIINIEYKFLKKIIWTYIDMLLLGLINGVFLIRVLRFFNRVSKSTYYDCFSLISIILFPRLLSTLNNYEFFHMIIFSLRKMLRNMIGMFCLFISMIFGFYMCFISLTISRSDGDIAFDMLKLFFGFTPAVWNNWDSYNSMGKAIQLGYLFLIQFIITTILAIVLGNVFAKITECNKEEFEYFKTTNLIIYLKWGHAYYHDIISRSASARGSNLIILVRITKFVNMVLKLFKFPIILIIFFYELTIKNRVYNNDHLNLKNFTFLDKNTEYYGDQDMVGFYRMGYNDLDDGSDVSILMVKSRQASAAVTSSQPGAGTGRRFSHIGSNANFATTPATHSNLNHDLNHQNRLMPAQSIYTLGNFRTASTDSLFIDEVLHKKYGGESEKNNHSSSGGSGNTGSTLVGSALEKVKTNNSEMSRTPVAPKYLNDRVISSLNINSGADRHKSRFQVIRQRKTKRDDKENTEVMKKLEDLEALVGQLVQTKADNDIHKSLIHHSDDSIIISDELRLNTGPNDKGDDTLDFRDDFQVQSYEGHGNNLRLFSNDIAGNIYNITEVSFDGLELMASSRKVSTVLNESDETEDSGEDGDDGDESDGDDGESDFDSDDTPGYPQYI